MGAVRRRESGRDQPYDQEAPRPPEAPSVAGQVSTETSEAVRGLFGRDSVYVLLWGLQLLLAAVITPLATRLLSSAAYGRVQVATAIMQVLIIVAGIGLQSAVQRHFQRPDGPRQARKLITLALVLSASTFVIADATGPVWSSLLRLGPYDGAIRYAVGWASLTAVSDAALGLVRSRDQLRVFATISLLQSVVANGLSLLLVAAVAHTPGEFLLGQVLAQALAALLAVATTRPLAPRRSDQALLREAVRYCAGLVPAALASLGTTAAIRLVIEHDLTSTAVARYSVAYNIGTLPTILLVVLDISWMPRIFALSTPEARGSVLATSRDAVYRLLVPTTIAISVAAPLVLTAWVPPDYHVYGLTIVVAILSVSALPVAGLQASTRILLITGHTGTLASRTLLASAAGVALGAVLIPPLGIAGAAVAVLIGAALVHVLIARASARSLELARPAPRLVAELCGAAAIAGLSTLLPAGLPFTLVRALVTIACAGVLLATLGHLIAPGRLGRLERLAYRPRRAGVIGGDEGRR